MKYLLVLVCLLTLSRGAQAQEPGLEAFMQGVRHAQVSDYQAALKAFEEAWRLGKDPQALFQIAKVEEARGDCARTLLAFKRFLTECNACSDRAVGEKAMAAVKQRCEIYLKVETTPSGARLAVGGEEVGRTPFELRPEPGEVVLRASLDGFASREERLTLMGGERRTLSWSLTPVVWVQVEGASQPTSPPASPPASAPTSAPTSASSISTSAPSSVPAGVLSAPLPPLERERAWAYSAWGLSTAGFLTAGVLHFFAGQKSDEVDVKKREGLSSVDLQEQRRDLQSYRNVSLWGSGVTALIGVGMFILAPEREAVSQEAVVSPWVVRF